MGNCLFLGPLSRPMPTAQRWSWGWMRFLMIEVPLCMNNFPLKVPVSSPGSLKRLRGTGVPHL